MNARPFLFPLLVTSLLTLPLLTQPAYAQALVAWLFAHPKP